MITGFKHSGLKRFYERGDGKGLNQHHHRKITQILSTLDNAETIKDMDVRTFRLHELKGNKEGTWSVWVKNNWRITFTFKNGEAGNVNYEDYH